MGTFLVITRVDGTRVLYAVEDVDDNHDKKPEFTWVDKFDKATKYPVAQRTFDLAASTHCLVAALYSDGTFGLADYLDHVLAMIQSIAEKEKLGPFDAHAPSIENDQDPDLIRRANQRANEAELQAHEWKSTALRYREAIRAERTLRDQYKVQVEALRYDIHTRASKNFREARDLEKALRLKVEECERLHTKELTLQRENVALRGERLKVRDHFVSKSKDAAFVTGQAYGAFREFLEMPSIKEAVAGSPPITLRAEKIGSMLERLGTIIVASATDPGPGAG